MWQNWKGSGSNEAIFNMGETEAYFRAHGKKLVEKEDMGEEGVNNTSKKERQGRTQWKELILERG